MSWRNFREKADKDGWRISVDANSIEHHIGGMLGTRIVRASSPPNKDGGVHGMGWTEVFHVQSGNILYMSQNGNTVREVMIAMSPFIVELVGESIVKIAHEESKDGIDEQA